MPPETSSSTVSGNRCEICSEEKALQFHYKVLSCERCKKFMFRSIREDMWRTYKHGNFCTDATKDVDKGCRRCRFEKCIKMGMKIPKKVLKKPTNFPSITDLKKEEMKRKQIWKKSVLFEDPGLEDVLRNIDVVNIVNKKPKNKITACEFDFIRVYSWICFFSDFQFFNDLSLEDKRILFTYNYLKVAMLSVAWDVYQRQKGGTSAATNNEEYGCIVPRDVIEFLITKFNELDVSEKEYLSMVMICFMNTTVPIDLLSDDVIEKAQQAFNYDLLYLGRFNSQGKGESRYVNLLSIVCKLKQTSHDSQFVSRLFNSDNPSEPFKKLVSDVFVEACFLSGELEF